MAVGEICFEFDDGLVVVLCWWCVAAIMCDGVKLPLNRVNMSAPEDTYTSTHTHIHTTDSLCRCSCGDEGVRRQRGPEWVG